MKNEHVTIERTGKSLKLQLVLSVLLLLVGICWAVGSHAAVDSGLSSGPSATPTVICIVAIVWWIVTKARIWWNHG